ncbi:Histone acetyltransferase HPA2 or related acetyltransferase [Streptococcus sp. DD10]|nr:Histone acetyltransferase HPA2 or related acetyltransferase [Streptococcus sp. DD10]
MTQEHTPIFVFENENKQLLGHLFISIKKPNSGALQPIKTLFIEDLCVDEGARGQKIGEQLFQFAEEYAKELGCYNLTLNVWNDNNGALRFYERLGLRPQETVMERILR